MSIQGDPEVPDPEAPEPEAPDPKKPITKIYYCEICKIPCMSSIILQTHYAGMRHKKKERALKRKYAPVISEEPQTVKRPLSQSIRCLKDYMKDPNRDEPLVGLEYVLELRFEGRREPRYECQLCQFNTDVVPMIQHLVGQKHRKAYLLKHFPDKGKKNPKDVKEDRAQFLKRLAREVENEEGLKMFKTEDFERPSLPTSAAKRKSRWGPSIYKPENDPVLRQKALEYMDFFEVTSDAEATQVIRIAQSLSEALKAFCEKKAALQHIRSLPPLLPPGGPRNIMQQKPKKPYEPFDGDRGDLKQPQASLSSKLRKLQSQLGQISSASPAPPVRERTASSRAAAQAGRSACEIIEWMKQFNKTSAYFQSNPDGEKSLSSTSSQNSYPAQHHQQSSTQKYDSRLADTEARSWESMKDSYSAATAYPASCPSKGFPAWYKDGNSSQMPVSRPAASNNLAWPQSSGYQQPNLKTDGNTHQLPFSGGSAYGDYQQQNTVLNNMMGQRSAGLSPNVLSQLRGKDTATLAKMLQELIPHYPDLQKIDIYALAQALSKIS